MAPDNTSLGQFNLDGLPPAPRGVPKTEMTFDIDADGILNVTAKDMASQRSQSIRITGSTRLPETEKQRMIDQAAQYAGRRVPAGTQPDSMLRLREKGLPRFGGGMRGDLYVRLQIHVPERLTDRQRQLFEQLRTSVVRKSASRS